jgi:hypothetical protein
MSTSAPALSSVSFQPVAGTVDEFAGRPGEIRFLDLPPRGAVMIDGAGTPGSASFGPRLPGLYRTAYGLRFALKRRGVEVHVRPLEGLWWTASGIADLDPILRGDRGDWRWTLLIVLPDAATDEEAEDQVRAARSTLDPTVGRTLRIETLDEGAAAQVLHLGPYADEQPTIEALHGAIADAGLRLRGAHHEIYLGDPSRSRSDRLRTLIRQAVEPA